MAEPLVVTDDPGPKVRRLALIRGEPRRPLLSGVKGVVEERDGKFA